MRRFAQLVFSVILLCGLLTSSAYAQTAYEIPDYSERIDSYDAKIEIATDSSALITENITYNFGSFPRHGIERYVPIKTADADGRGYYYYKAELIDVKVDGQATNVKKQRAGNYFYLRIGDPDKTITGAHNYQITYRIEPVMEKAENKAVFIWDVVGDQWRVPIREAKSKISFPDGASINSTRCYAGKSGTQQQNCQVKSDQNTIEARTTKELPANAGITVYADDTTTQYSNYLFINNRPTQEYFPLVGYVVGVGALIFGLSRRLRKSYTHNQAKKSQTIIPQYDAPDGLSPGEVGHLIDNSSSMVEITATLIDLARRGHIRIEQSKPRGIIKKAEYTFYRLSGKQDLVDYETKLLEAIFDGKAEIKLKDVSKTKVPSAINQAKVAFKKNLEAQKYYPAEIPAKERPKGLIGLSLGLALIFCILNVIALGAGVQGGYVVWSFIVGFLGLIFGSALARYTAYSQSGYQEWAKIEGLKLFLSVTEKDRMAFHNAPKKTPNLFNKLLPYAIALGVEKEWAKQFEGMDLEEATSWYGSPTHNFSAYYLASSLSSDFSGAVASNFSPPSQSSSSGGGGGGFSGGGGGGGGGGSW